MNKGENYQGVTVLVQDAVNTFIEKGCTETMQQLLERYESKIPGSWGAFEREGFVRGLRWVLRRKEENESKEAQMP